MIRPLLLGVPTTAGCDAVEHVLLITVRSIASSALTIDQLTLIEEFWEERERISILLHCCANDLMLANDGRSLADDQ